MTEERESVPLGEHFDRRLADLIDMLDERYRTQTKASDAAFAAQQTAMQTAFAAADKAVDKALAAAEKAVEQRASTLDKEFHEHLEQVRHENSLAFFNSDKAVQAALTSAKEAVTKSENASEKRFESVNEFRRTLSDQAALFLPRTEYDANHKALESKVTDVTDRMNRNDGKSTGTTQTFGVLLALATVVISIVVIFINVITG